MKTEHADELAQALAEYPTRAFSAKLKRRCNCPTCIDRDNPYHHNSDCPAFGDVTFDTVTGRPVLGRHRLATGKGCIMAGSMSAFYAGVPFRPGKRMTPAERSKPLSPVSGSGATEKKQRAESRNEN